MSHSASSIWIPPNQRNPYTVWYKYAQQNVNTYNLLAMKYNINRLQPPPNVKHQF